MYSRRHVIGIVVLSVLILLIIVFSGMPKGPEKPQPKGFPKELVEPCIDKEEGDNCTVEDFRGAEESVCEYMEDTLVCFPHRMPPPKE